MTHQTRRLASFRHWRALLAMSTLIAVDATAQTARITGRVVDTTSAVIPSTSVTIRGVATGMERAVSTNDEGYYTVPLLPPGEYRATISHAGFKPVVRSGIVLEVDQRAELNF